MDEHEAARLLLGARRASGLSQSELARRAGIQHSVLSAYEHGRRDPTARSLARLLEAAGFRLTIASAPVNVERAGRMLADALRLADKLPIRRRSELLFPSLPRGR
jgi:transcriptional regulator with XRE-family HTH domain